MTFLPKFREPRFYREFERALETSRNFSDALSSVVRETESRNVFPGQFLDIEFFWIWITSEKQTRLLKTSLSKGLDPNYGYEKFNASTYVPYVVLPLLILAIRNLAPGSVQLLLDEGADPLDDRFRYNFGVCKLTCDVALDSFVGNGFDRSKVDIERVVRILRMFLKAGVSPQWSPGVDESLPHIAHQHCNWEALDLFLDHGARLTTRYRDRHGTREVPLLFLSVRENLQFSQNMSNATFSLITKGADIYDPLVCFDELPEYKIESLKKLYLDVVKTQFAEVAIGLRGLDLPVMCVLSIQNWVRELHAKTSFTMHKQWSLAKMVKEFGTKTKD